MDASAVPHFRAAGPSAAAHTFGARERHTRDDAATMVDVTAGQGGAAGAGVGLSFKDIGNLLKRGDSEIEYGNLLTVPLEGGLLYVEPVYVRGAGTNYPRMRKVLVTYGERIAFENTLGQALDKVFDAKGDPGASDPGEQPEEPPASGDASVREALKNVQDAYDAGQDALEKGDWKAYGKAQDDLRDAIREAQDAEKDAEKGAKKE